MPGSAFSFQSIGESGQPVTRPETIDIRMKTMVPSMPPRARVSQVQDGVEDIQPDDQGSRPLSTVPSDYTGIEEVATMLPLIRVDPPLPTLVEASPSKHYVDRRIIQKHDSEDYDALVLRSVKFKQHDRERDEVCCTYKHAEYLGDLKAGFGKDEPYSFGVGGPKLAPVRSWENRSDSWKYQEITLRNDLPNPPALVHNGISPDAIAAEYTRSAIALNSQKHMKFADETRTMTLLIDWRKYKNLDPAILSNVLQSNISVSKILGSITAAYTILEQRLTNATDGAESSQIVKETMTRLLHTLPCLLFFAEVIRLLRAMQNLKCLSIVLHPQNYHRQADGYRHDFLYRCLIAVLTSLPTSVNTLYIDYSAIEIYGSFHGHEKPCGRDLCNAILQHQARLENLQIKSGHVCEEVADLLRKVHKKIGCRVGGGQGCKCTVLSQKEGVYCGRWWDIWIIRCGAVK